MGHEDAQKWDERYASSEANTQPIPFLVDHVHELGSGSALVLAAGTGRNAVYLAQQGLDVTALDVSQVGLARCQKLASEREVRVTTVCTDLENHNLGEAKYDLITKIYYYQPGIFPAIRRALKSGGRFLFQTFSKTHADVGTFGPRNPDYLACQSDVLEPFQNDRIILYEDRVLEDGEDTEAIIRLIIEKR